MEEADTRDTGYCNIHIESGWLKQKIPPEAGRHSQTRSHERCI